MSQTVTYILRIIGELLGRFAVATIIGCAVVLFDEVVMSKFMNHLGMAGNMLVLELGLLMLFEIPIWMLCVKIVGVWHRSAWAEIIIAGLVAVASAQWLAFNYHLRPNFITQTIDSIAKSQMLFWFVLTLINYLLATHTAALYCGLVRYFKDREANKIA